MISDSYKRAVSEEEPHWLQRDSEVKTFLYMLRDQLGALDGLTVLDAGCAQGRDVAEMAKVGLVPTGIDSEEAFIREAKEHCSDCSFDVGSIEWLPYADASFDAVYCVNTLFYTNPEESFPELERVLRVGGIAFLTIDAMITDLDANKRIHTLAIDEALRSFAYSKVLSRTPKTRTDQAPFRHVHAYEEIVLRKV